jgi:hypothetical protein
MICSASVLLSGSSGFIDRTIIDTSSVVCFTGMHTLTSSVPHESCPSQPSIAATNIFAASRPLTPDRRQHYSLVSSLLLRHTVTMILEQETGTAFVRGCWNQPTVAGIAPVRSFVVLGLEHQYAKGHDAIFRLDNVAGPLDVANALRP